MQVWNVLRAARWKYRTQKSRQKSPSRHHRTTLSGYIFATKAHINNREKNLLSSNMSSTCPHNMVNFSPLTAEIVREFGAPLQISTGFESLQPYCTAFSSGRQPNYAALKRRHHLRSAGRPSRWALAHILVNFMVRVRVNVNGNYTSGWVLWKSLGKCSGTAEVEIFIVKLLSSQHKNAEEKLHCRQTLNDTLHIIHFLQHLQIVYNTMAPFYIRYAVNLYLFTEHCCIQWFGCNSKSDPSLMFADCFWPLFVILTYNRPTMFTLLTRCHRHQWQRVKGHLLPSSSVGASISTLLTNCRLCFPSEIQYWLTNWPKSEPRLIPKSVLCWLELIQKAHSLWQSSSKDAECNATSL